MAAQIRNYLVVTDTGQMKVIQASTPFQYPYVDAVGALVFGKAGTTLLAAFGPGRWASCELETPDASDA